ncbi:NUDIX hydrolase [Streptococcus moroccensis]|uniref:ADP-ribose pyrophosphatase YjhB (NUDIX family) n=1 Tax=Streptococcus moroccensis TaxID=1451356 RepID=A0ABT9YU35_9STRE|nr:NUDIX hydrolase N-terminal domain-containing protein [Streptococcus moroccensis]MDQ0223509.1 ADP-ribose pyrophosphatase YjhB (NUDIX family) [Streptococcus moroccensis]
MAEREFLKAMQKILAIANTGLFYSKNSFDQERYQSIRREVEDILNSTTTLSQTELTNLLRPTDSYETPLVDVRAFILKEGKVCLVKDRLSGGKWALPGGFAEVGLSPTENVIKEVLEETGYTVSVKQLLAIFDSNQDPQQVQSKHYYKLTFWCQMETGAFEPNEEISELAFFDLDHLPLLSVKRTTEQQIKDCYRLVQLSLNNQVYDII